MEPQGEQRAVWHIALVRDYILLMYFFYYVYFSAQMIKSCLSILSYIQRSTHTRPHLLLDHTYCRKAFLYRVDGAQSNTK